MTDEAVKEEAVSAPVENVPSTNTRRVGAGLEAALKERTANARKEELYIEFRGKKFKVLTPIPAAVGLHAASGSESSEQLLDTVRSLFAGDDGDRMVEELLDTKVDVPVDDVFIGDLIQEVLSAASGLNPSN